MSYIINRECIDCNRCLVQCPTKAIQKVEGHLTIDKNICNDCVGYHGTPQCAAVCPTNSACQVSFNSEHFANNYWSSWFERYNYIIKRLKTNQQPQYWQEWFNNYSQRLTNLISSSTI